MPIFIFTRPDGSKFEFDISLEGAFKLSEKHNLTYKRKEIPKIKPTVISKNKKSPTIIFSSVSETHGSYSIEEGYIIINDIINKHFQKLKKSINGIPSFIFISSRSRKMLGIANYYYYTIKLNSDLLNKKSKWLKQVIFHELTHIEFPNQGHQGKDFRRKEYNNPYRYKKTNKLRCVS